MDLTKQNLEVRLNDSDKCWHHIHGIIDKPKGWTFVPSGDSGLTRTLKTGQHWVFQDRSKTKTGRKSTVKNIGLLVPNSALKNVKGKAKTKAKKISSRASKEKQDILKLEKAVIKFLAFDKKHATLAKKIAKASAETSAKIGSGSVGRTKTLPLTEKAKLCARAYIRHNYTDYDKIINNSKRKGAKRMTKTSQKYKMIKHKAHREVDEFLNIHR